jgi:transcriptional accessory protein Tex/SPT6
VSPGLARQTQFVTERDLFTRLRKTLKSRSRCSLTTCVTRCWLRRLTGSVVGPDPVFVPGKVAVVDATGKLVETATVPHEPRKDWEGSSHSQALQSGVNLIATATARPAAKRKLAADR